MGDTKTIDMNAMMEQAAKDAATSVLLDILYDSSLLTVIRIVIAVRWGSVGATLRAKRKAKAASRAQPVEGER